jgi:hypothetical protein
LLRADGRNEREENEEEEYASGFLHHFWKISLSFKSETGRAVSRDSREHASPHTVSNIQTRQINDKENRR